MSLSTANINSRSLESLVDRQSRMSNAQQHVVTGKRVNVSSDDPAAAARSERALASERRSVASQRAVDASNNALSLTDSALADAGGLLQQAREALVAAGSGVYSDSERLGVANQLTTLRDQLLQVANRTDGGGTRLFGGQGSNQAPFVDQPGGVRFQGTAGPVLSATAEGLPLTVDGQSIWTQARTGNGTFATRAATSTGSAVIDTGSVTDPSAVTGSTYRLQFSVTGNQTTYSVLKDGQATAQADVPYVSGQAIQVDGLQTTITGAPAAGDGFELAPSTPTLTVFDALDKAIADLKTPGRTGTQIAQTNAVNLANLDSVLGGVLAGRAQVGANLNRVDAATDRLSSLKLSAQTERSNAEDADLTQAISDFTNQQTGYDAALKAYSMVQNLSLFKYLNG